MTAIDITPAGNHLYQVDISDGDGESHHELTVPDDLVERWQIDEIAMNDVVLAAVDLLVARDGRQSLDERIDLADVAVEDPELIERIPEHAHQRATEQSTPSNLHRTDPDEPSGDERLLEEVKQEQAEGSVSSPEDRR